MSELIVLPWPCFSSLTKHIYIARYMYIYIYTSGYIASLREGQSRFGGNCRTHFFFFFMLCSCIWPFFRHQQSTRLRITWFHFHKLSQMQPRSSGCSNKFLYSQLLTGLPYLTFINFSHSWSRNNHEEPVSHGNAQNETDRRPVAHLHQKHQNFVMDLSSISVWVMTQL